MSGTAVVVCVLIVASLAAFYGLFTLLKQVVERITTATKITTATLTVAVSEASSALVDGASSLADHAESFRESQFQELKAKMPTVFTESSSAEHSLNRVKRHAKHMSMLSQLIKEQKEEEETVAAASTKKSNKKS